MLEALVTNFDTLFEEVSIENPKQLTLLEKQADYKPTS